MVRTTTLRRVCRGVVAALCATACVVSVAACGSASGSSDHTIKVGIKFDQPGLGFKKSGTYEGFDVDVARYIANQLGYTDAEIEFKEAPSKQREAMLQNGDVDMILASYSITDERKKAVDFAGPYFVAGQDLLIRSNEKGITGPQDLNGKRLCSVTGSTSAKVVKEKFAKEVQLMEQPGYAECATALLSGIVDAVTTDDIILAGLERGLTMSDIRRMQLGQVVDDDRLDDLGTHLEFQRQGQGFAQIHGHMEALLFHNAVHQPHQRPDSADNDDQNADQFQDAGGNFRDGMQEILKQQCQLFHIFSTPFICICGYIV